MISAENESMKVVIIGDSNVGKTSIISRLMFNQFSAGGATVAAVFHHMILDTEIASYSLDLWDTAGQEKYHSVVENYFRGASGGVVVFDVTDPHSLSNVRVWCEQLKRVCPDAKVMVIANKNDCEWRVKKDDVDNVVKITNALYFETSAKSGENVKKSFIELACVMRPKEVNCDGIDLSRGDHQDGYDCC
ncbi:GTP-binding protein ypt5, putative [Entamoeba invadens IP1]|uniref:GTP-binding protein ypt5, putative n=1 Tax=Entamoeba invadens IP1 TaxID=370355 RepID=A0A0A1U156_ENTIV|nr:GTP-binding protein ypt5, putative [Entamoeba invadens IP1]ELP87763.1 GTP-binding protein ypt5, putative [Entamoeba invadens IP1]|eukprot:XP_004254534.1 GTP-binding protein ypt5, putative [Entamoeba invadens IP1]